jgi:hypothetical protein
MANRWKGNFVVAAATTSSGTDYTGKANGAWGLNSQLQQKQSSLWAKPLAKPAAPTIGIASKGNAQATISFTAPTDTGGQSITGYTVLSSPGNITGTGAASPITVSGLTNGIAYTFTVAAINASGTGAYSSVSNSITPSAGNLIAVGNSSTSPYITMYPFDASTGFGTKFSDPTATGDLSINSVTFSADTLFVGGTIHGGAADAYPVSGSGFGTKYADPSATMPARNTGGVTYNSATNSVAFGANATPYVQVYAWNSSTGFGSKYANPATLPIAAPNDFQGVTFNSAGNAIATSFYSTPYLYVYSWSSSGFGTKFSDPASPVIASGNNSGGLAFNGTDTVVASCAGVSPYIVTYNWSNSTGFGSKFSAPATSPTGAGQAVNFNKSTEAIVVGHSVSPFISVYPWSSGFGSKYSNPATLPNTAPNGVTSSSSGAIAGVSWDNSGTGKSFAIYPWGAGFGTKFSDPASFENYSTSIAIL